MITTEIIYAYLVIGDIILHSNAVNILKMYNKVLFNLYQKHQIYLISESSTCQTLYMHKSSEYIIHT